MDVTYQALKRLTWLPEREAADNGNVIAGQEYDDVYFVGGEISNVTLTNVTINGTATARTERVITAAGGVTVASDDYIITMKKTVGQITTITLPASPTTSRSIIVKDGNGDAATYNITISGNGKTIDGAATFVLDRNFQAVEIVYNGTEWNAIGSYGASSSSSAGFDAITSGTNTTAAMVVGTGASLAVSGSGTITATAVPVGGISGLGTGVATALAVNVGSAGAPVVNGGALGTPSSGVATNLTGTAAGLSIGGNAATATTSTNVTVANEASDTTCFPLFATAATGNLPPKSNAGLAFDSSTGTLTTTALASGVTTLTTASASAFAVGANGATNPSLLIDNSTGSQASGVQITGRATGTGPLMAAIGSGANQPLSITTKGTGALNLQTAGTGVVALRPAGSTTASFTSSLATITTEVDITGSTTIISATASIDAAAILGQDIVTWTPSAGTSGSGTFVTNRMRKTIVDTTNGAIVSPGHAIGGYDYIEVTAGANTIDLMFVHEAKYKKTGSATVQNISFYKPAIDSVAGSHTNITLYDGDMDLSGVTYTNAYLMDCNRSYLTFRTSGKIVGATGNEVPTTLNPGITTGRYYFSAEWGSASSAAVTKDLLIACPPIIIPARTTFTRIGVRVVTGVASSAVRFGIYKMENGVPTTKIYGSASATATTSNNVDVEDTISVTLEAGAYFLAYQNTGGATGATVKTFNFTDSYIMQLYGNASSQPDAATVEDWLYIANTGALPTPFGAVTRTRVGGALPAVYLKA